MKRLAALTAEALLVSTLLIGEPSQQPTPPTAEISIANFNFEGTALSPETRASAVAIEAQTQDEQGNIQSEVGSGILVRTARGRKVLTAAHVIIDREVGTEKCGRGTVSYAAPTVPNGGIADIVGNATDLDEVRDRGLIDFRDRNGALDREPAAQLPPTPASLMVGQVVDFVTWEPLEANNLDRFTVRSPSLKASGLPNPSDAQIHPQLSQGIFIGKDSMGRLEILSSVDRKIVYGGASGGGVFTESQEPVGVVDAGDTAAYNPYTLERQFGVKVKGVAPDAQLWITSIEPVSQSQADSLAGRLTPCTP